MKTIHWSDKKTKPRQSAYRQTLGNPYLRSIIIEALYGDLSRAKEKGQEAYAKYIGTELMSLGEGDWVQGGYDTGNDPNFRN